MSFMPLPAQAPQFKIPQVKGSLGSPSDLTMQDKLFALAAILKGDNQTAMQIPMLAAARRQQAEQQAATTDLARFASGQPVPQRADIMRAMDPQNAAPPEPQDDPPAGSMGLAPRISVPQVKIPQRSPAADAMGGPVSVRSAAPALMRLIQAGGNPAPYLSLLQAMEPKPRTPLNTSHGVREYDPATGEYRHLEDFADKPEPVTVDRVIAGILTKAAAGQALSPAEKKIYDRWNNGTPPKAAGGSTSGLPAGFVLD